MWLFLVLVSAISNTSSLQRTKIDHINEELREGDIYFENDVNPRTCTDVDISVWPSTFDECFITKKIGGVGWNLANTVDRILQHAGNCVITSKLPCRPNYNSFQAMMNKVINELKDYSISFWLEMDFQGKRTMKDLDCVENVLSIHTYDNCFEPMFDSLLSHDNFLRSVENAISCTNEPNKLCSNDAKTSLNRMVRTILGVKQPAEEDFEKNVEPTTEHPSDSPPSTSPPRPVSLPSFGHVRIHRGTTLPPSPYQDHHATETPLPSHTSTSLPNSSPSSPNQHHSITKPPLPPTPSTIPPTPSSTIPRTPSSPPPPLPNPSSSTLPPRSHHHHHHHHTTTTKAPLPPSPRFNHHHHYINRDPPSTTRAPPPPTKRWYDYILDPIISAWNWFTSLFG